MSVDVKKLNVTRTRRAQRVVERLAAGPSAAPIRIETPQGPVDLCMRELTAEQESEAQVRAYTRVIDKGLTKIREAIGEPSFEENVEHFKFLECLALAIVDPKTGDPVYRDGADLAANMTEARVIELLHEQASADRDLQKEVTQALDEIKKKGDCSRLRDIAHSLPKSLLLTTVDQLANLLEHRS